MQRRRYLVAYDVRDEKRLRQVHKVVKGFGFSMQYSVFVCDLDRSERDALIVALQRAGDTRVDSVALVDLGDPDDPRPFTFLGPHQLLPRSGSVVL